MKTVDADQIPSESIILIPFHLFVQIGTNKSAHLMDAPSNFPRIISLLSPLHSSPAGGAKTQTFVCQTPLNLRGRSLVTSRSLLFCCDDGLIQTVRNVVSANSKIQFLNQVSKYL